MNRDIKTIETRYRGYQFRSRLEARWAIVFDALGLGWDYEHQGFTNGEVSYLPDFLVTGLCEINPCTVEIKPKYPTNDEWRKIDLVDPLVFIGSPLMDGDAYLPRAFHYVICDGDGRYVLSICRYCNKTVELLPTYMVDCDWPIGWDWLRHGNSEGYRCCNCCENDNPPVAAHPRLIDAYQKAMTWRF